MNSVKILVGSLDHYYPGGGASGSEKNEKNDPETPERDTLQDSDDTRPEEYSIYTISEDNQESENVEEMEKSTRARSCWSILYVIPHLLVVKPLMFLWWIISFPFGYLYDLLVPPKLEVNRQSLDEKTELLKQENILSNTIKSPTASSKYIIPPPQRLFQLSRNKKKKKNCRSTSF